MEEWRRGLLGEDESGGVVKDNSARERRMKVGKSGFRCAREGGEWESGKGQECEGEENESGKEWRSGEKVCKGRVRVGEWKRTRVQGKGE